MIPRDPSHPLVRLYIDLQMDPVYIHFGITKLELYANDPANHDA